MICVNLLFTIILLATCPINSLNFLKLSSYLKNNKNIQKTSLVTYNYNDNNNNEFIRKSFNKNIIRRATNKSYESIIDDQTISLNNETNSNITEPLLNIQLDLNITLPDVIPIKGNIFI